MLVRGSSCTGKTRTAFEAVHACLPDWQLVYPKNSEGLLALLDAGALAPRTVLWLNETQNYLDGTSGEQAAARLHSLVESPGPVVILGTLWPEHYRALTATPQPGQDKKDAHPNARVLLGQAVLINVPAFFTKESLQNPLVNRDPSLAAAAATRSDGRIAQTLAAGPELVDHYEQATEPQGPYGRAVISAAMDARRLGHTSPLSAAFLEAAAPGYLTDEQRAAADPNTWFAHAVQYAGERVMGVARALEPVAQPHAMGRLPDVYNLNDYLDQHGRTERRYSAVPASLWEAFASHADRTDLTALALSAWHRGFMRDALRLHTAAVNSGHADSVRPAFQMLEAAGRADEGLACKPSRQLPVEDACCLAGAELAWPARGQGGQRVWESCDSSTAGQAFRCAWIARPVRLRPHGSRTGHGSGHGSTRCRTLIGAGRRAAPCGT